MKNVCKNGCKRFENVCKNGCKRFAKCLQEWLQKICKRSAIMSKSLSSNICKLFPPIVGYQINLYTPVQAILYSFCIPIYARNVPLATLLFIANNLTYVVWYHISIFSLMCRMLYLCYLMLFKNKFHICSLMLYFYQCTVDSSYSCFLMLHCDYVV